MAQKKTATAAQGKKKPQTAAVTDRAFQNALANVEKMAKERIGKAKDPVKTGLKLTAQIREVAESIETEIMNESLSLTEASDGIVGVGIGVF